MPRLIHIGFRITDLASTLHFYGALGFVEYRRNEKADGTINVFIGLPDDGDRLQLMWSPAGPGTIGGGCDHIAVTLDDLSRTLTALMDAGLVPAEPSVGQTSNGSPVAFVDDPDGYTIELIEKPDA